MFLLRARRHNWQWPPRNAAIKSETPPAQRGDYALAEPNADLPDKVSTTNPIFVVNQSGHIAYVNHKAFEESGITEDTPDPGNGGVYVRDANGDRTIDQVLNVYDRLLKGNSSPASRRLRIEHFTVTTEDEVVRAAKLGVTHSMTIGHVNFWGEVFHNHILGEDRANRLDPTGSLEKNRVRFSFHSDSPVSPYNPLQYISTGASRLLQKPPLQSHRFGRGAVSFSLRSWRVGSTDARHNRRRTLRVWFQIAVETPEAGVSEAQGH